MGGPVVRGSGVAHVGGNYWMGAPCYVATCQIPTNTSTAVPTARRLGARDTSDSAYPSKDDLDLEVDVSPYGDATIDQINDYLFGG